MEADLTVERAEEPAAVPALDRALPPLAGELAGRSLSLAWVVVPLALLPAAVAGAVFLELGRRGASAGLLLAAAALLLAVVAAIAVRAARGLARPLRLLTRRARSLAPRGAADTRRQRSEAFALACAFDGMTRSLLERLDQAEQRLAAETQAGVDMQRQFALMQMLRNLALAGSGAQSLERALQESLREIGDYLDWPVGRLVLVARQDDGSIADVRSHWFVANAQRFAPFIEASDRAPLETESTGLIGRAQQSNLTHWFSDLSRLDGWARREAALAAGLRTGFVIPLAVDDGASAFVEFFTDHRIEANEEMLELVEAISIALWRNVNRGDGEDAALRAGLLERQLAACAESACTAMALAGPGGGIEWANAAFARCAGAAREELAGRDVGALLFGAVAESAAALRLHRDAGKPVEGLVLEARGADGAVRWLALDLHAVAGRSRSAVRSFIVVHDISAERATQARLEAQRRAAEQVWHGTAEVLASVAAEVRRPADGMLEAARRLAHATRDEAQRAAALGLQGTARALAALVGDVLDYAAIESGALTLEPRDVDLPALLEDVLEQLAPAALAKGLELVCDIPAAVPAMVRVDPARLRQVLGHLAGTAIGNTQRGEVVLAVRPVPRNVPDPSDRLHLRFVVRDTGVGVPAGGPQARDAGAVAQRARAEALGLVLCRRLVALMQGTLGVTRRVGEGSVYEIELALPPARSLPGPVAPVAALAGQRVMLAIASPAARAALNGQLEELGLRCAVAENGRQALQMLQLAAHSATPFAHLVADAQMCAAGDLPLVSAVRADGSLAHLHVVQLAPLPLPAALPAGVDALVARPVRRARLLRALVARGTPCSGAPVPEAPAPVALPVAAAPGAPHALVDPHPVLDADALGQIAALERNGARDLLARLVAAYVDSSRELAGAAAAALSGADCSALARAAHTLKSSSDNLGARRLGRLCGTVERLARQGRLEEARRQWERFDGEHERVLAALLAMVAKGPVEAAAG